MQVLVLGVGASVGVGVGVSVGVGEAVNAVEKYIKCTSV